VSITESRVRPVRARWSLGGWTALGTVASVGLVVAGSSIGAVPAPPTVTWWFHASLGGTGVAHVVFTAALVLMVAAWVGVGTHAWNGGVSVGRAWVLLGAWGVPLFAGPPLFSRDVYSYVGQGLLAHLGLDPYTVAPSALGPGPVLSSIASVWRDTASPYGPSFVLASRATVAAAGHGMVADVLAFRLLELVGVALLMVSLPVLARRHGQDPGTALWLGAVSPLALFSFVSSAHNDALMVGLMVAGVTLATGGRLAWGLALVALAATIKLPALVAVVFLAADELSRASGRDRVRVVAEAVLGPALVIVVVTVGAGFGWTWLGPTALHVPTELRVLITPVVSVGSLVWGLLHLVHVPVAQHAVVSLVQDVAELVAVGGIVWLTAHARERDAVRLMGAALVLLVLGSPTVWPWYWTWGVAVLAATPAQRSRALAALAAGAMLVVGAGGTPLLNGGDYWVSGTVLVVLLVWYVRGRRWRLLVREPSGAV
jgi:hypothetical protein